MDEHAVCAASSEHWWVDSDYWWMLDPLVLPSGDRLIEGWVFVR